ncbi:MAG: DNA topoisomerase [Candidatus Korarchaeota archaeon]
MMPTTKKEEVESPSESKLRLQVSSNSQSEAGLNNKDSVSQVYVPAFGDPYRIEAKQLETLDLMDAVKIFLDNINLPEIKSPGMQRYSLEKILKPGTKILVITEKPKVAQALSKALANGKFRVFRKYGVPIFSLQYKSHFVTVVPLKGHILEYDTKDEYRSWSSVDPIKIIKDPNALILKPRYPKLVHLLRAYASKHDVLIIATDADEEGENIGFEAAEVINKVKKMPVYRMWFISTHSDELIKSFNNPTKPIITWALAPEARKIIDGFAGFSSTRELTLLGRGVKGPASALLRNSILSLGRVQSPTLYLLYLRERYIKNFKPKPYWSINANLVKGEQKLLARHKDSPFYDKTKALDVYERIKRAEKAEVINIESQTRRITPPPPLDTNKALVMLNRILGLPSDKAMKVLEDLYLDGLITYPRTDTDKYPPNYNHAENLSVLARYSKFEPVVRWILSQGAELKRNGRKLIGDHLPITPIDVPAPHMKLSQKHIQVYELIVRRYLALFMNAAELEYRKVAISIGGEVFYITGVYILNEGFWRIYAFNKPRQAFPDINKGEVLRVSRVNLEQKSTKPPKRLSEAELLKLMEKLGLGTKATRPEHIQKLVARGYVIRRGRTLIVTELGYRIAELLEKIWPEFLQPYFCAYVLSLLRQIMNGEIDYLDAIEKARKEFLGLFLRLRGASNDLKRVLAGIIEPRLPQDCAKKNRRQK